MPDDIARAEEKCMERLKSKIQVLETSYDFDTARLEEKCERLQKQLDIAEMALKEIEKSGTDPEIKTVTTLCVNNFLLAHKALKEIEELNK